ncbi:hypothetical protein [Candidatus Laterigemmans baculatus]|uniref:hypothetical protein n=1 Tax=Candidatus Laterigemmans baculatus TaxID=2770505 RepID=UPI0013DC0733|nr:hypothetical protein [Candidatus Laterigemmans baculatus]
MSDRRFWISIFLVLAVALGLRIGVASWWQTRLDRQDRAFGMGDSEGYWVLAGQLAAGLPYQYGSPDAAVFRAPGYPLLLSPLHAPDDPRQPLWSRSLGKARLLGCVLGTLAVGLVIGLSVWLDGRGTAIIAGTLAALYPGGVTMSVLLLSEAPFVPLMLLVLGALVALLQSEHHPEADRRRGRGIVLAGAAGCLSGLAVLTRPSWLLFLPFYFALRLVLAEQRRRELGWAIVAGTAMAVTMAPWWVRNYRVTGQFVPTTLQVGASLYDGWHAGATGASDTGMEFSSEFAAELRREDAAAGGGPRANFEYRLNQRMAAAAVAWAREHPGEVVRLAGAKIARTWWPWPSAAELPGGAVVRWAFALGALAIAVPGAIYAVGRRFWRSPLFPLVVPVLYFTLLHAVFVGSIRYRQPALVALIVLAAPQYMHWWRRLAPTTATTSSSV